VCVFYPPLARVVRCGVRLGKIGTKLQIIYIKTVYIYVLFVCCVLHILYEDDELSVTAGLIVWKLPLQNDTIYPELHI
jgi:hypothetical protein